MSRLPAVKRRRLSPPEDDETVTNKFYQNASQWNLEEAYAKRTKKQKAKDKKSDRLPIKTQEGKVEQAQQQEQVDEPSSEDEAAADQAEKVDEEVEEQAPEAPTEPEKPIKQQILEAKEDLARIAGMVSEDPEENISQLKSLAQLAANKNPTIKQLAMATQVAVFKDIIPGYRIRPLGDEDPKAKLSRDVKRLRHFEQTLVSCYKEYVNALARCVKAGSRDATPAQATVASMAINCTSILLEAVPHFNFRSELLNIIVSKLSSRQVDKDFVKCREALETLFQNDEDGNSSLEAVSLLTKMMKSKDYNIHESVLNTFLHLRLLSEYSYRASTNRIDKDDDTDPLPAKLKKKQREFRTKRERKQLRERKVVEKEMAEADAAVSHEERDAHQSEMLKLVFVAYFRILKQRKPNLMGAVLEGLARYAHLINQDFFGDVLESLRDLITSQALALEEFDPDADEERDMTRETLLCIVTAFALLQGQDVTKSASSLSLDLSFFSTALYNTVLSLSLDPGVETFSTATLAANKKVNAQTPAVLLLRSLNAQLLPPHAVRAVPPTLLAAFTKRLLTASLALPEKAALAVLSLVKQVVRVHGSKIAALWYTDERRGDGVFDITRTDVESANPFAATVWESEMLKLHYCPKVREAAIEVEKGIVSRRS
ncbi:nucleolar complex-associated protein 3 [Myriangium duriaei CBS 260.36]|uniref:Nucleolar complex-associated protein 3 n=1 Tax=Myriangium duriaei CBS 260.36 TaxID=1168546 RepID=A0A9P4IV51_9PEZI|nr:nucleolar complex-associated protein 3 [Myriangium duriaei CBS 260.36]